MHDPALLEQGDIFGTSQELAGPVHRDDDVRVVVAEHPAGGQAQRQLSRHADRRPGRPRSTNSPPCPSVESVSGAHMSLSRTRFICSSQIRGKRAGRAAASRDVPADGQHSTGEDQEPRVDPRGHVTEPPADGCHFRRVQRRTDSPGRRKRERHSGRRGTPKSPVRNRSVLCACTAMSFSAAEQARVGIESSRTARGTSRR